MPVRRISSWPKHSRPTAVDLFAGAGGFSLAARKQDIKVLAAIENNSAACDTYQANLINNQFDAPVLFRKSIEDLSPVDFIAAARISSGTVDILMGGPPCQGFSTHRIKDSGVGDPRNALLLQYFMYLQALRPRCFIVENVPGMLWPRHEDYIKNFYEHARMAGYDVLEPVVLNAKSYGVPQNRKRVFIVGFLGSIPAGLQWPPFPTHYSPSSSEVLKQRLPGWRTAAEVFALSLPDGDPNNIHMNHKPEMVELFRSTPLNGGSRHQSGRVLPCHRNYDGHRDVYGRINPDLPGPTMTTACVNPSKGRFLHPTEHHGITVRHAARFQTFPDDYVFHGGLMASGVQVGNAVPILLGETVLSTLVQALP
ncbi:DNA cytosine methyltransferase [Desulfocurvibacter africanus]|uniref:DNA cytosine methyltransferase n=1 Tax=Desulfocurvibacter africanus TaxID=873 RepID=UPI002FD9C354